MIGKVVLAVPINEVEELAKQLRARQLFGQNDAGMGLTVGTPLGSKGTKVPSVKGDEHAAVAGRIGELVLI